ncbi:MAG: hypothetical protein OEO20_00745 [Gemmatimonadota bacterium]|nr:hypothetical protein [Gemmatimonadota bacterium]MDH3367672.1 hypothetical protein [Gemmatimonadota bacterium]MDH3476817.1 hypothetical protein [Gemmatimonadota bacterium]MDH3571489.1 hypothetical protein [Gemmatimonadota bacterium]MDH5550862.1 hypothetical protein [Gemmatimonadota bacterium]
MNRRGTRRLAAVLVAAVLVGSCDSGPKSGEIVAELTTPHSSLGAAMFRVNAIEPYSIESVTEACTGCSVFTLQTTERELRGVVTGTFSAGPLLRVLVSDRNAQNAYSVTLMDLALPTYELMGLFGSSLSFPVK